jgi:release factor glutamine methyltransferase
MKTEIYSPREDSYLLSEVLKKEISYKNIKVLELGSGSGIQLETLNELGIEKENIFSCDINPEAVKHCKDLGFNCIKSNLFQDIKGKFDVIIFNPPYLPKDSSEPLDSRIATTGGNKGSEVVNEFLKQAKNYLNKDGKIFLLTSSLTENIDFLDYKKKILGKKKIFFEELIIWELEL